MQKRPILNLEKRLIDQVLTLISYSLIIAIIAIPFYFYNLLPERIPTHFGLDGEADYFRNKNAIWFLPILSSMMFAGLYWSSKKPFRSDPTQCSKALSNRDHNRIMDFGNCSRFTGVHIAQALCYCYSREN